MQQSRTATTTIIIAMNTNTTTMRVVIIVFKAKQQIVSAINTFVPFNVANSNSTRRTCNMVFSVATAKQ